MLYNPCICYTSEWFVARRGFANGVIFAGTAAGGVFFPLVLPVLIDRYGTSVTLRIISITFAVVLLPFLPFIRGRLPQAKVMGPISRSTGNETDGSKRRGWMKSATFRFLMIANTLQALGQLDSHYFRVCPINPSIGYFVPIVWLPSTSSFESLIRTTLTSCEFQPLQAS